MNNKKCLDIGILYLCVHKRIYNKIGLSGIMKKKDFNRILAETYHIPKVLRIIVLKEMIKMKMIKELDKGHIKTLPLLTDPEINVNRFYKEIGIL